MAHEVPLVDAPIRWLVVAMVAGGILATSVTAAAAPSGALGPLGLVGLDKWFHALGYAGLAGALAYALAGRTARAAAVAAFIVAVAFGLGVELLQTTIPSRAFSLSDLLANATGAALVAIGWPALVRRLRFRRRSLLGRP